jgi:hypothetical protein
MKYITAILAIFFFTNTCNAQNLLKHYERNASFTGIILPLEKFNSSNYKIVYADSVYDVANITIKKADIGVIKNVRLVLDTKDKVYVSIECTTKSKKKYNLLKLLIAKRLNCTLEELCSPTHEFEKYTVTCMKKGRNKIIVLKAKI